MNKRKKSVVATLLLLVFAVSLVLSGCNLVQVNPEKDNAQTLMTIQDESVTKSVFNNNMASMEMYYTSSGSTLPTGKDLEVLKQNVLTSIAQTQILAYQAKQDKRSVDEAAAKKEGEEAYTTVKETVGKNYETILKTWNSNDEAFKAYMIQNAVDSKYAEAAQDAAKESVKADSEAYFGASVGTVDGKDVGRGEYTYYFIGKFFEYYMSYQTVMDTSDDELMEQTNSDIFNTIGKNRAYIQKSSDDGLTIQDTDIATQNSALEQVTSSFFQDETQLESFLDSYFMSVDQYKSYRTEEAKAKAAEEKIKEKMINESEVTDAEIEKYFNANKTSYDQSTVSACHILTSDQKLSNEIYTAAKDCKTKADFEKVMETYKENESVEEAADLGSHGFKDWVEPFSKQAFSMAINTVSSPTKTEFGYHVIFVYDKNEVENTLDGHKDEIKSTLQSEKGAEKFESFDTSTAKKMKSKFDQIKLGIENYVEGLKTDLNVKIFDDVI